jgi:hypothetical protein
MKVISIHDYELRTGVDPAAFEEALRAAEDQRLLDLPGLIGHHFVRGLKGTRRGRYSAIWLYEDRAAWEVNWGTPNDPKPRSDYPAGWLAFEDHTLRPFLSVDPDALRFTAYEEIGQGE